MRDPFENYIAGNKEVISGRGTLKEIHVLEPNFLFAQENIVLHLS